MSSERTIKSLHRHAHQESYQSDLSQIPYIEKNSLAENFAITLWLSKFASFISLVACFKSNWLMKNSLFSPLANLKLANFEAHIACIRLPVNWDSPGAIHFTAHDYQTHSTPRLSLTDKVTLTLTQN